jgi:hypothetical protein
VRLFSIDTATQGESERVFRPTHWLSSSATLRQLYCAFDAFAEIVYNGRGGARPYQNAPFAAAQLLSGQPDQKNGATNTFFGFQSYQCPSGMSFDEPYVLDSGESLGVNITPTYTGLRDSSIDSRIYEYEVVAILEGFKRLA